MKREVRFAPLATVSVAVVLMATLVEHYSTLPHSNTRGFRDFLPESGVDFRMSFLPEEQGAAFRVNLYDHGGGGRLRRRLP